MPDEYDLDNPPWATPEFGGDSDKWGDEQDRADWYEAAAHHWAGRAESLEGSRGGGRIGPEVKVRFTPDQLVRIDTYRDQRQVTRAEAIRRLVTTGYLTWETERQAKS